MKRKQLLLLAGLSGVTILYFGFLFWNKTKIAQQTKKAEKINTVLPKEVTIELSKHEFSPKEMTIKTGTAIRWKNISGAKQTVNSDDYPTNQKHKELNFGVFADGATVVYVFDHPGTYGYHNQFHPEQKGKIIVTK